MPPPGKLELGPGIGLKGEQEQIALARQDRIDTRSAADSACPCLTAVSHTV
jgi:hypothetical protein